MIILFRHGTEQQYKNSNFILQENEMAIIENDKDYFTIMGDGITPCKELKPLPYNLPAWLQINQNCIVCHFEPYNENLKEQ